VWLNEMDSVSFCVGSVVGVFCVHEMIIFVIQIYRLEMDSLSFRYIAIVVLRHIALQLFSCDDLIDMQWMVE